MGWVEKCSAYLRAAFAPAEPAQQGVDGRLVAWLGDPFPAVLNALGKAGQFGVDVVQDEADTGRVLDDVALERVPPRCYVIGRPAEVVDALAVLSAAGLRSLQKVEPLVEDRFWSRMVLRKSYRMPE